MCFSFKSPKVFLGKSYSELNQIQQSRVIYSIACLVFSSLILVDVLVWQFYKNLPFPDGLNLGLARRLVWCTGWSFEGFALAALYALKSENSIFPSYFWHYPLRLLANSLLGFGVLNLVPAPGAVFFYPVSAWFCFGLGISVDWANFQNLSGLLSGFFRSPEK